MSYITYEFEVKMKKIKELSKQELMIHLLLYAIGVVFMPLGVVCMINAHLGAGGYDALNFALAEQLNIKTSYAIYGTALVAVFVTAFVRKGKPRFTTFISSFLLGIFTDMWKNILKNVTGTSYLVSLFLFIIGVIVIAVAVSAYINSIFPSNPTDDLVVALHERGVKIGVAKIGFDIFCVIVALLLQGEIGLGTIICTFALGALIEFFNKVLKRLL